MIERSEMAKHLTAFLAAILFCVVLASVSQQRPVTVSQSDAASAKATTKPAPKPRRRLQWPTPSEEKQLLDFLKRSRREFYNGLMAQKKTSDKRYRGTLKFAWQWYKRYRDLDKAVRSEVDREQKTRIEISKILGKIKKTSSETDRKKLTTQLERLVGIQFDVQMKVTKYKLDQTANQLSRLRKELQNRQAGRKAIVAQRVQEWLKAARPAKKK